VKIQPQCVLTPGKQTNKQTTAKCKLTNTEKMVCKNERITVDLREDPV
jgi:hypothetical protein